MGYIAVAFGSVANGAAIGKPLDIHVREREIVMPLKVAYVWTPMLTGAARTLQFAISRAVQHRSDPPSGNEMIDGGSVFFGVGVVFKHTETQVGVELVTNRVEFDLRGVKVAGDLTVCVDSNAGQALRFRCEFFYEILEVSKLAKAVAMWRRETKEQPN